MPAEDCLAGRFCVQGECDVRSPGGRCWTGLIPTWSNRYWMTCRTLRKAKAQSSSKSTPICRLGLVSPAVRMTHTNPPGLAVQSELERRNWLFSDEQIQFRNTVMIDLSPSEEDLLMRMKSKTRYNVRLAGRKGVTVRAGGVEDIDLLYKMYATYLRTR